MILLLELLFLFSLDVTEPDPRMEEMCNGGDGVDGFVGSSVKAPVGLKGDGVGGSGKGSRRKTVTKPSMDADEFINLLHGSDPVKVELNRLENEVRGLNVVLPDLSVSFFLLFFLSCLFLYKHLRFFYR